MVSFVCLVFTYELFCFSFINQAVHIDLFTKHCGQIFTKEIHIHKKTTLYIRHIKHLTIKQNTPHLRCSLAEQELFMSNRKCWFSCIHVLSTTQIQMVSKHTDDFYSGRSIELKPIKENAMACDIHNVQGMHFNKIITMISATKISLIGKFCKKLFW